MAPSIGMIFVISFSSTVRVCSVMCKTRNSLYARGSNLLYYLALLSVGSVAGGGSSTYNICSI